MLGQRHGFASGDTLGRDAAVVTAFAIVPFGAGMSPGKPHCTITDVAKFVVDCSTYHIPVAGR